jgi:hypothetical protein
MRWRQRPVWWICMAPGCGYRTLARRMPEQCHGCGSLTSVWLRIYLKDLA